MQRIIFVFTTLVVCNYGQRSPYAGKRPIGYPELDTTTTTADPLGNRFGDATTERLPIEALGDRDLVNRISKLPIDQQPFWYINWKALEENRKRPQTYPHNQSPFLDNSIPAQANPQGNTQRFVSGINQNNGLPQTESRFAEAMNADLKSPEKTTTDSPQRVNPGDIDHILGMPPRNDSKRNAQLDQAQGNKAINDYMKYFMKRN